MFGSKSTDTPLIVEVTETGWSSFGDPANPHHTYLQTTLEGMGGVNESVPPGTYHFNVQKIGNQIIASLNPVGRL